MSLGQTGARQLGAALLMTGEDIGRQRIDVDGGRAWRATRQEGSSPLGARSCLAPCSFPSFSRCLASGTGRGHTPVAVIPRWVALSVVAPVQERDTEASELLPSERRRVRVQIEGQKVGTKRFLLGSLYATWVLSTRCQVRFVIAIPLCSPNLVASHGAHSQRQSEPSVKLLLASRTFL